VIKLAPQKVEKRLLSIHDGPALRLLLGYRPWTFIQWRVHAVACTILDTGRRIDELLTARATDFDFDSLLLTVIGKGRKQRKVPFSTELRKLLFRFEKIKERSEVRSELMFPARDGGAMGTSECSQKLLLPPQKSQTTTERIPPPEPHLCHPIPPTRGDVVRLSIILEHTEVSTTMKYLHLLTEDLQRPHQGLSILNRLR
jgi:site-specific recombinase XerD